MHYPLFLNLKGKKVAVFGAGKVAARKVKRLIEAGARIEILSKEFSPEIKALQKKNPKRIKLVHFSPSSSSSPRKCTSSFPHGFRRESDPRLTACGDDEVGECGDDEKSIEGILKNAALGFVATSDRKFNRQAVAACRKQRIWVNAADRPKECDFYVPSLLRKKGFHIAISTNGKSPSRAKKLRQKLEKSLR